MTELRVGSPKWRTMRDYLLARAMYRASCCDGVAKVRLSAGHCEEAAGVEIMQAVVKHLPGALQDEAAAEATELTENLQSQAEVEEDMASDDPGRSENDNRLALDALKSCEEVLRRHLDVYEYLLRDFPEQVGNERDPCTG